MSDRRLRSACPPHADEAAVYFWSQYAEGHGYSTNAPPSLRDTSPKFEGEFEGGLFDEDIIGL